MQGLLVFYLRYRLGLRKQPSKNSNTAQPAQLFSRYSTPLSLPPLSNNSTPRLAQLLSSSSTPRAVAQETLAAVSPSPFGQPSNVASPAARQAASPAQSTPRAVCLLFKDITRLLRGVHDGGTPLLDILSDPKLMKPSALPKGLDLKATFKGTSTTAFPKDIGKLATRNLPLYKIPYYYFGLITGSTKLLLIFIFFPELHVENQYKHSKIVNNLTLASYLPASKDTISRGVTIVLIKTLKRKESARKQLLEYRL
ncbi:hypothetical protein BU23DRAFT_575606 [Bimuria novae-zelandiae CBS 107.79]|uniref:Uncharacterized protein n=1 Tax=Bimuria novae-zelandiae CBS 107.79 TaxID=1447943 RepID=A0A6A5UL75_9PLEO|nr:hypothetical protein BU23DRAFT_575606 [Bimuria novae-zelandiae CBS 107.79]